MTEFRHAKRSEPGRGGIGMRSEAGRVESEDAAAVVAAAATRLRVASHLYFELELSERNGLTIVTRHHRSSDVVLREYGERFYTDDPLTQPFRSWLECGDHNVHGARVVSLGELPRNERTDYEDRFLRRAGIADVIGLGAPVSIAGRTRVLCFGFHRRAGEPSFTIAEKRVLARLGEGLRLRGENLALREAASLQGAIARTLIDREARGWILFDDRLRPLEVGGTAALLKAGGVDRIEDAFHRWFRSGSRHMATGFRIGPDGARFLVDAVRRADEERWWLVRSAPAPTSALSAMVDGAADLTGREWDVVRLLAAGSSNPELARMLGLTINTVENHLRSIYGKLGVRSRGQAVALLMSIKC